MPTINELLDTATPASIDTPTSRDLAAGLDQRRKRKTTMAGALGALILLTGALSWTQIRDGDDPLQVVIGGDSPTAPTGVADSPFPEGAPDSLSYFFPLHRDTEDRDANWTREFFVPYGSGDDEVELSIGGDAGGTSSWGPDTAVPADPDTWWYYDAAQSRVELAGPSGTILTYTTDMGDAFQLGAATPSGDLLTHPSRNASAAPDAPLTRQYPRNSEGTVTDGTEWLPTGTKPGPITVDPTTRETIIEGGCPDSVLSATELKFTTGTPTTPSEQLLSLEAVCGPDHVLHILILGSETTGSSEPVTVATYVRVRPDGIANVEPMGTIWTDRDPGSPSHLHIVGTTGDVALSIAGTAGLEGWVRTGDEASDPIRGRENVSPPPAGPTTTKRPVADLGDVARVERFLEFSRDPSSANFEALGLADTVTLGLGPTAERVVNRSELRSPGAWMLEADYFRAYVGPFSALETLSGIDELSGPNISTEGLVVSTRPHAHCASGPVPPPPELEGMALVSVQPSPSTYDSCLQWSTVDLFIDDQNEVAGITLDLWEP